MSIIGKPRDARYIEGFNNTGSTISAYLAVMGYPASITLPAAVSSPVLGITARDIADQERGDIQYDGVAIGTAGEAISAGDIASGVRLYAATTGKLLKWSPSAGVNQSVCGIPLSTAAADGDQISVMLLKGGGIGQGA